MLIRFFSPLVYSLLLGGVWSGAFKKKFSSSLAPAFMSHVIVTLLTGLILERLSIGVYGGIITALLFAVVILFRNRKILSRRCLIEYANWLWDGGTFVFLVFYVFCFVSNYGKRFLEWDEFSHWGMFLKESLRLDSLYCTSPLIFAHKDYVPAITLFEVIWCKMSGRYSEADAYRAIQIFMFSMLMPMFESFSEYTYERIKNEKDRLSVLKNRLFQLSAVLFVLLIPLLFHPGNGFCFYHSIYCDLAVGIIFFWCVYKVYKGCENTIYGLVILTIGMTVLVLSKMMAMALMPLVVLLLVFIYFSSQKLNNRCFASLIPVVAFPAGIWIWFNRYVDGYVNYGGAQSYEGMKLSSLGEVFTNPDNSAIPYLRDLRGIYIDAVIHRDILIHGSYIVVITFAVIGFVILSVFLPNKENKRRVLATGIWVMVSGTYYMILMFFLYATAFSEYEAIRLASYERYMNSFVISVVMLLVAVYFDSDIWKQHIRYYCLVVSILIMDLSFFHISAFDQMMPGRVTNDDGKVSDYLPSADVIMAETGENASIYIIKRGDNGDFMWHERYYCSPRALGGGSIGPAIDDDDIWSTDISVVDFLSALKGYDYIYLSGLDRAFIDKYSDAFDDPTLLVEGAIYRISEVGTKIKMW